MVRIRTQFIITMLVFGISIGIISASAIITTQKLIKLDRDEETAASIALGASELSYLSNDYMVYRESQQLDRWQARYASFLAEVDSLPADTPEQQALITNIQANARRMKEVFDNTAATIGSASGGSQNGAALDQALLQVSWSRMAVQSQSLVSDAIRLSALERAQADQARQVNLIIVLLMVGVFIAYLLFNYTLVQRRMLKSIAALQADTAVIGSGDLEFKTKVRENDEIGDLAHAFNQMTASLREATASKAELEAEIAARKDVEEELTAANEHLQENTVALEEEIAERRKAEEALRSSENELGTILASVPLLMLVVDSDRRVLRVNTAAERFIGRQAEDILGLRNGEALACLHALDDPRGCGYGQACQVCQVRQTVLDTIEAGRSHYQVEWSLPFVRDDRREELTFLVSTVPLATSKEQTLICMEDITERKKAQQLIQFERDRLVGILNSMEDGVAIMGPDFNIDYVNPPLKALYGEIGDRKCYHYFNNRDDVCPWCNNEEVLGGQSIRRDSEVIKTGRTYEITDVPLKNADGSISKLAVFHDVTERKRMEQLKDEFISLVSHELRTPLTVISGSLDTAMLEGISPADRRELLQNAIYGAGSLGAILENMLELSRHQAGRLQLHNEPVSIPLMAGKIMTVLKDRGASQQFLVEFPSDLPPVDADPVRVERILYNLVENATKYSPSESTIRVFARPEGNFVVTGVADEG
ncbi:MAG: PAS domain-containing protein, partial [Chloroflexi bacterium]|nr:PAS domain-containing protein [Chloroflexota bacterium]